MIITGTNWERKSRLNVESDLAFNGIDQQVIGAGHNLGSEFTVCAFCEPTDLTGARYLVNLFNSSTFRISLRTYNHQMFFQVVNGSNDSLVSKYFNENAKLFFTGVRDSANHYIYKNGILNVSAPIVNTVGLSFDLNNDELRIGEGDSNAFWEGTINHVMIFNRALLPHEIQFIYLSGGIMPESAHANCVAHYPLTQQYYPKASASFIAKHSQFALNDLVAFDTVEQYNYAKSIADAWNESGASHNIGLVNNGDYFECNWQSGQYMRLGVINPQTTTTDPLELQFFISIDSAGNDYWGLNNTVSSFGTNYINTPGDTIKFQINGTDLEMYINGVLRHTYSGVVSGTLYPQLVFYNSNCKIDNVNINGTAFKFSDTVKVFVTVGEAIKSATLTANHAKLINFTDTEANSSNLAIKDFYSKQSLSNVGYSNKYTDADFLSGASLYEFIRWDKGSVLFADNADWAIFVKYKCSSPFGSNFGVGGARNSVFGTGRLALGRSMLTYYEYGSGQNFIRFDSGTNIFDVPIVNNNPYEIREEGLEVLVTNNSANQELKIVLCHPRTKIKDSTVFDTSITALTNSYNDIRVVSNPTSGNQLVSNLMIADSFINGTTEDEVFDLDYSNVSNLLLDWRFTDDEGPNYQVKDVSGNGNDGALYINDTTPVLKATSSIRRLEWKSKLPSLNQAFNMDDTFTITTPTSVGDLIGSDKGTVLYSVKINDGANLANGTQIIVGFVGKTPFRYYAIADGRLRFQNEGVYDFMPVGGTDLNIFDILMNNDLSLFGVSNTINEIIVNGIYRSRQRNNIALDVTGTPFQIKGTLGSGIAVVRLAIWDRILSVKEAAIFNNNKMFSNPSLKLQEGLICYYNMNLESFFEDGLNVLLKDYSGKGYDAIVAGLAGVTSADQLADVTNHLIDLNELR